MKAGIMLRIMAWGACLAATTAFSAPVADTGGRLARSLRGATAKPGCDKCEDIPVKPRLHRCRRVF